MSAKNSPPLNGNGDAPYDGSRSGHSTPGKVTRTVAIIKNHALEHRFDIERQIQEASFEVRPSGSEEALNAPYIDCQRAPDGVRYGD